MMVLKPGFTLPMYQYLPLINQRIGASLYDRKGYGKPWKDKDKDNYDLGFYGNEKYHGIKKKPGKPGLTEAMKDQMMNMMNEMQEQQQPSFIEMILTDPTFPYILPIIIVVSLACILVPLTGWLFTGFLTDNFAYLDEKNSVRFNHTFLQTIFSQRLTKLLSTVDRIVERYPIETSNYHRNNSHDKMCAL